MTKTGKKFLALLLAALMLFSIAPLNGLGELLATKVSAVQQGDYYYEVIDGKAVILNFDYNEEDDIVIPDTFPLNGVEYPVTRIGDSAFSGCSFKTVKIPDSVTTIDERAFNSCYLLTGITLPDGITSIGDSAFTYCTSLKDVVLSGSLTEIGESAFRFCGSLESITIPASVTSIGDYAFSPCNQLTEIKVEEGNPNYSSENGILYNKDKTQLLQYPVGKTDTSYTIPAGVTSIGNGAFGRSVFFTEIIISPDVTEIGENAFSGCMNLENLTIGENVTNIGIGAFLGCESLTAVVIPDRVIVIGGNAFSYCDALANITLGTGVTTIGSSAFYSCPITSITLPINVSAIDGNTFSGCDKLTEIIVDEQNPNFLSEDGVLFSEDKTQLVFYPGGKEGATYNIPDGVTDIGDCSFYKNSKLTDIVIANSVTRVGKDAFGYSSVESVTMGTGVTLIDEYAFRYCNALTGIVIPDSVKNIEDYAFNSCNLLADVDLGEGVTRIGSNAFSYCPEITSIAIPDSVTILEDYAFNYCQLLANVTLGNGLTYISGSTFSYCALTAIEIPSGVTGIDTYAFHNCDALTTIDIPDSVTEINSCAFSSCDLLESVTLGAGLTTIGVNAFSQCKKLGEIDIPEGVTNIGERAFYYCEALATITLPDSLDYIGSYVFIGTAYYEKVDNWKDGVLYIGNHLIRASYTDMVTTDYVIRDGTITVANDAFFGCGLTSVTIPDSVENIGDYAFYRNDITAINISSNLQTFGNGAISECKLLETITVAEDNPNYTVKDGVLFDKNQTLLIAFPLADTRTDYEIPDTVKIIGEGAFNYCSNLQNVTIPFGVTRIGMWAFKDCTSLANVEIPVSVITIGYGAFYDCSSFTSMELPKYLFFVDPLVFGNCTSLKDITIPNTALGISYDAFENCTSLTDVYYGGTENNWDEIGLYYENDLLNSHIHCEGEEIFLAVDEIFGFLYIVEEDGNAIIIDADSELSGDVAISEIMAVINIMTEETKNITVTAIGAEVFADFDLITSVTLPATINYIGADAFAECDNLTEIFFEGTIAQWNAIPGIETFAGKTVQCSDGDPNDPDNPDDPDDPGAEDYTNAKLPETTVQTAKYKNNVTVKITARGIPATGFFVVDGTKIAPDATGTATFEAEFQAKEGKSFKAHIEDKDGNVKVAEKEYKVNVDTGFFAKLVAFFVDFIFNGFKWKKVNVEF